MPSYLRPLNSKKYCILQVIQKYVLFVKNLKILRPSLKCVQSKDCESHPWLLEVISNGRSRRGLGCEEEEDQLSNLKCAPLKDYSGEV